MEIYNDKNKKSIKIIFDSAWAYRNVYETFRMNLITQLSKKYGSDFYGNWSFFKIENSSYLKWLSVQSYEISDICKVKHFVLLGVNSMLDIATIHDKPEIKIIAWDHGLAHF